MTVRQTEPIEAPNRPIFPPASRQDGFERIHVPQPHGASYIPVSREQPTGGNIQSQVRGQMPASRAYHPGANADENRIYPSIETPQSPPRRLRVDHMGERDPPTVSDGYPRQPRTPQPRPIDDLSRQVRVIGIDDERDQAMYKRRRVEYDPQLHDNLSRENHVNQVRYVGAPSPNISRDPQHISLISPQSGRGPDRIYPRIRDENAGPAHEFAPVVGRQLEKHPVGRGPSLIPSSHHPSFPGSFEREGGHNYRAPISLHHPRHDSDASLNSFKPPPPPISISRESGHMARDSGYAVRSNQIPNMVESRYQPIDRQARRESEAPRLPRAEPFREGAHPLAVRDSGAVRHHYISSQSARAGDEGRQEFARGLPLRDKEPVSYYDTPQLLPKGAQSGPTSRRRDTDPYPDEPSARIIDRPPPRGHVYRYSSPQHPHPESQVHVPRPHRLVRIGPGSVWQDDDKFRARSPMLAAPREMRGRPLLDHGRYAYRTTCFRKRVFL